VLWPGEIEKAIELLLTTGDHGRVHAALQPAIDRFGDLDDEEQEKFRRTLPGSTPKSCEARCGAKRSRVDA